MTEGTPHRSRTATPLGVAYYRTGQKGLTTDIYTRLKALDADAAEHFFERFVLPNP
jgi:hypothetical protein